MVLGAGTIILRVLIVLIAASLFGLQRQRAHKPIGFGTYIFVAVGACAAALIALDFSAENPLIVFGAVVTGVGFLGAGALIKTSDKVMGFTSAATVWLFAILGFVVGTGDYTIAILMYLTIWIVVAVDYYLEGKAIGAYQIKLLIITNKIIPHKEINKEIMLFTKSHRLTSVDIDKKNNKMTLNYIIEGTKMDINKLPDKMYQNTWCDEVKIE
jgi:putative Mg2+ transporter-C (MgtC) family protein